MDTMGTLRRTLHLLCIVGLCIALINANSEQNSTGIGERYRRSLPIATFSACGQWSQWVNRNTPSSSSPNEYEHFTDDDLRKLCPSVGGVQVKQFQCQDEKLEPVQNVINRTEISNAYTYTCNEIYATCKLSTTPGSIKTCPDFSIRIICECPSPSQPKGASIDSTENSAETRSGSETEHSIEGSGAVGETETGTGDGESSTAKNGGVDSDNGKLRSGTETSGTVNTDNRNDGSGTGTIVGGSESINAIETSNARTDGGKIASTGISGSGIEASGGSETDIGIGGRRTNHSGGSKTDTSIRNGSGTGNEHVSGTAGSGAANGNSENFCGNSFADGSLLVGGVSLPWWLVPLSVLLLICIINLCVICCVYRKLKRKIRNRVFPH